MDTNDLDLSDRGACLAVKRSGVQVPLAPKEHNLLSNNILTKAPDGAFCASPSGSSTQTKVCRLCHQAKSLDHFFRCKRYRGGFRHECKECLRDHRRDNPEPHRIAVRKWQANHRAEENVRGRQWQKNHPLKRAAHQAVYRAIKSGRLIRPDSCSQCGRTCTPQGHHEDYKRPLDVIWCCVKCHNVLDRERQEREARGVAA